MAVRGSGHQMQRFNVLMCLDAADISSYPRTGSTWNDTSGNSNNSTLVNSPAYVDSGPAGALSFNGTDQYVSTVSLSGISVWTISIWFRSTSTASNATYWLNPSLFGKANSGNGSADFGIGMSSGNIMYWHGLLGGSDQSWFGPSVNDGQWKNVVVTSSGSATSLYLNGDLRSGSSLSINQGFNSESFWIAARGGSQSAGGYLACSISHVAIYQRNLTATDIRSNFDLMRGRFGV